MKIVLRKEMENIGEVDAVAKVSDGYARNYLLPRGIAVVATPAELAAAEKRKAKREKKLEAKRSEFEQLAQQINDLELEIPVDAGEGGKLFGSVTTEDIALAVREKSGLDLDKKKIELSENLKMVGEYTVTVKIYKEISAQLKIKLIAK